MFWANKVRCAKMGQRLSWGQVCVCVCFSPSSPLSWQCKEKALSTCKSQTVEESAGVFIAARLASHSMVGNTGILVEQSKLSPRLTCHNPGVHSSAATRAAEALREWNLNSAECVFAEHCSNCCTVIKDIDHFFVVVLKNFPPRANGNEMANCGKAATQFYTLKH